MKTATFLFGLPCSGKTQWYKNNLKPTLPTHTYINADDIKFEFPDYSEENGSMYADEAIQIAKDRVIDSFIKGEDIVFDAGSINSKYTNSLLEYGFNQRYTINMIFIDTPYEVCIDRNSKRTRKVPESLILDKEVKKMSIWHSYTKSKYVTNTWVIPYYTEKHLFFDMDGVLAVQSDLPQVNGKIDFVNSNYYRHLPVVPQVRDIINNILSPVNPKMKVYILSATPTSFSAQEKLDWLNEYFPFIKKENIFFVNSGQYKAEMFSDLHKRLKLDPKDTCLVEDTHSIIKSVRREYKMHSIHISEFLQKYSL